MVSRADCDSPSSWRARLLKAQRKPPTPSDICVPAFGALFKNQFDPHYLKRTSKIKIPFCGPKPKLLNLDWKTNEK